MFCSLFSYSAMSYQMKKLRIIESY